MEEEILPYVAGLMDGEGSITIGISKPSKKKQLKSPSHWLQVGITNTNRELIGWLYEKFGGHISDNSHSPSRKKQRPCWAWRVMSNEAKDFLVSLYPYLRVKKRQAELAILKGTWFPRLRIILTARFAEEFSAPFDFK